MATRFYLPRTAEATAFSPTPDAAWEVTSALVRCVLRTTKIGDTLNAVNYIDSDATNQDIIFRQYVSALALSTGQTITGGQAITCVAQVNEFTTARNLFLTLGIRIINIDGTVKKTVLAVTRDGTEAATSLTNRTLTANSVAGDYTTVSGDYLVVEIGVGGDPDAGSDHDSQLRLGDSSATDLTANDTGTAADNPWLELADNLTFASGTTVTPTTLALTITRFAPQIRLVIIPPTKALTITAFAPRVVLGTGVVPPTATLTTTHFAPTVSAPRVIIPPTKALTITPFAPSVSAPRLVTPSTLALTITTYAPQIRLVVTPPTKALTITTYAPSATVRIIPGTRALVITAYAPSVGILILGFRPTGFASGTGRPAQGAARGAVKPPPGAAASSPRPRHGFARRE